MSDYDNTFVDWVKMGEVNQIQIHPLAQPWLPGTWYGIGERVYNQWTQRYYRAMTAGMSACGSSGDYLPWPGMEGCTVLDGTILWVSEGFPYPTGNRAVNPTHVFIPEWAPAKPEILEPEILEPLFEEREI